MKKLTFGNNLLGFGFLNYLFGTAIISIILEVLKVSFPAILFVSLLNIFYTFLYGGRYISIRRLSRGNIMLIFFLLISASYLLKSNAVSLEKYILILYNIFIPIIVLVFMVSIKHNNERHLSWSKEYWENYIIFLSVISLILFTFLKHAGPDGRYILPGLENTIWVGRHFGGLFIAILLFGFDSIHRIKFLIILFLSSLLIYVIFIVESRGVILSTILITIIYFFEKLQLNGKVKHILRLLILLLILYGLYSFYINLLESDKYHSLFVRFELLQLIDLKDLFTFYGNGLGSWGPMILGLQERHYPHNLFIEILFDFGTIGLIFTIYIFRHFVVYKTSNLPYYMALYFFLLSMSSGDIPGNNYLFISIFLVYLKHIEINNFFNSKINFT